MIDGIKFVVVGVLFDGELMDIFGSGIGEKCLIIKVFFFGIVLIFFVIGFEMNSGGVIIFVEKKVKFGFGSVYIYFVFFLFDLEFIYIFLKC